MAKSLKMLIVVTMLALVPLRALAAVTVGLCADYQGGATATGHLAHHHDAPLGATLPADDGTGAPSSVCSLCTACCTGASFAPDTLRSLPVVRADLTRVPFSGRSPGAHVPDELDRPPVSR